MPTHSTAEHRRLEEARGTGKKWRRWGPYLSERQWGTVREDYSADGEAWENLPFDHAHLRAYRWGEDGLLGFCDNRGLVCFAIALWNGADPILKERLFGLNGKEGNHGEDVKELYWYEDATPTSSYARALYKYPHRAFPYDELRERSRRAGKLDPEPEILETGVFDHDRYFDVQVEYAKEDPDDILEEPRRPRGAADGAAAALVPEHVELVGGRAAAAALRAGAVRGRARRRDRGGPSGERVALRGGRGGAALHGERVELDGAVGHAEPRAAREGRVPRGDRPPEA
jgi:hypothetical protein